MTRLVSGEAGGFEAADRALRPQTLAEFVGQAQAKGNLKVFIEAARARGEALDHVLLFGPPGLGKTTLAQIIARELGVNFRATSGPVLAKAGDLAAILTNLEPRDVLFIDEIHRLAPNVDCAMRLTATRDSTSSLAMYIAVASPSTSAPRARITSEIFSFDTRFSKSSMCNCSGPMPLRGESFPIST